MTKKKIKTTKVFKKLLIFIIIITVIISVPLGINIYYTNQLINLKYEKISVKKIIKNKKAQEIIKLGYNETLNEVFASKNFNINYLENYKKIEYNNIENFTKHINNLIDKGYSNKEVSLIIKSADNVSIKNFNKLEKQDKIIDLLDFKYAKLINFNRYVDYQNTNRTTNENTVTYVNIGLDKPFYTDYINLDNYEYQMLVNKYRMLEEDYNPNELKKLKEQYIVKNDEEQYLNKTAADAFYKMADDMAEENLYILSNSSYRSFKDQEKTYKLYLNTYGENYVKNYVAKPGFSEHQTGLALDIASKNNDIFNNSKEASWLLNNAYKYGFILRYPKNKESITGYKYEPWHYRYVGIDIATYIYENDLTFDEYYIRFLDK